MQNTKNHICPCGKCWIQTSTIWYNLYDAPPVKKRSKAGAIIESQGRIVCIQSCSRKWGFPKGSSEANETLKQTATREVQEETGLLIKPNELYDEVAIQARSTRYFFFQTENIKIDQLRKMGDLTDDITGIAFIKPKCLPSLSGFNMDFVRICNQLFHLNLKPDPQPPPKIISWRRKPKPKQSFDEFPDDFVVC